jgi:hypothetical protein
LIELGVLDANHRRAILNKATGSGGAAAVTDDFDNMLGDLDSVIKDLEMFSVVVSCTREIAWNASMKARCAVLGGKPLAGCCTELC